MHSHSVNDTLVWILKKIIYQAEEQQNMYMYIIYTP